MFVELPELKNRITAIKDRHRGISGVYGLVCPIFNRVRYVGQSMDIGVRYYAHLNEPINKSNYRKKYWFEELADSNHAPILTVIKKCWPPESLDAERETIRIFKACDQCDLNQTISPAENPVDQMLASTKAQWRYVANKFAIAKHAVGDVADSLSSIIGDEFAYKILVELYKPIDDCKSNIKEIVEKKFPEWGTLDEIFNQRPIRFEVQDAIEGISEWADIERHPSGKRVE